jgi:hypothetical protein
LLEHLEIFLVLCAVEGSEGGEELALDPVVNSLLAIIDDEVSGSLASVPLHGWGSVLAVEEGVLPGEEEVELSEDLLMAIPVACVLYNHSEFSLIFLQVEE